MRFVDLFLYHGTSDAPNWHGIDQAIPEMISYRVDKLAVGDTYIDTPTELTTTRVNAPAGEGYRAASMPLSWILDKTVDADLTRLLTWVSGAAGKGKIRINMHGDGKGHGLMMNSQVRGAAIGKWLYANGLRSPAVNAVVVIALPICWCARNVFATSGLTKIGTDQSDTKNSLMHELHGQLASKGLRRIKITGAPDMIEMGKRKWARATVIPGQWQTEVTRGPHGHVVKLSPGAHLGTLTYEAAVPGAGRDGFRLTQATSVGIQGDVYQLIINNQGAALPTSGWQFFQNKPTFKSRRWYLTHTIRNAQVLRVDQASSCFEVLAHQLPSLRLTSGGRVTRLKLYGVGANLVGVKSILVTPPEWYYHIEINDNTNTVEIEIRPPKSKFSFEDQNGMTPARFKVKFSKTGNTQQVNHLFGGLGMNILKTDYEGNPIMIPTDGFTCVEAGNDLFVETNVGTIEEDDTGPLVKITAKRLKIAQGQNIARILVPITDNQKSELWLT